MYRIMVPLDGTPRAEHAIMWADALATALDGELHLVRVVTVMDVDRAPTDEEERASVHDARAYISAKETETAARRPAKVIALLSEQTAPEVLAVYAKEHAIDLVVMVGHGRSGVMRTLAGSVAGELVHDAAVPTLVIGPHAVDRAAELPDRILVPLDNSDLARTILAPLLPLARLRGAKLVLFRVLPPPEDLLPVRGGLVSSWPKSGAVPKYLVQDLDTSAQELRSQGFDVEVQLAQGDRAEAICQVANEVDASLIAMSTHSLKGIGHWLIQSVAEEVIGRASVPVLTYHPIGTKQRPRTERAAQTA